MTRRKSSIVEDLVDVSAKLPWWAGVVLALSAYFILHPIATQEVSAVVGRDKLGEILTGQMAKTFAMFGQYLLPAVFLIGALVSALNQRKRHRLLSQTQERGKQSALLEMTWREFETLVGEVFRRRGYAVAEIGGNGPDGGVDLELRKGNELHLVQCKQWKALKVGVDVVRQLYGVMAARGATGGFVVTTGKFTSDAIAFSQGQNIELIDGEKLFGLIQAGSGATGIAAPVTAPATAAPSQPACPRCGGVMVRRVAKQGSNAGKAFWGCTGYPKCRGIVSIETT